MSAISSASGGGTSILDLLRQTQQADRVPNSPGNFRARFASDFKQAAEAAGVDPTKVDDLYTQVQQAIQGKGTDAASGTDRRAAFKAAVDSVLKQNGVDLTKFHDALSKVRGARHHGGGKQDKDGDSDGSATANSATSSVSTAAIDGVGAALDVAA